MIKLLKQCKKEFYATIDDDVCVARNSLAVVTYWCQGKHKCEFQTSDLEAAATYKEFFVPEVSNIKNFDEAKNICHKSGGSIALVKRDREMRKVTELFNQKSIFTKEIQSFWLHTNTSKYFQASNNENATKHDDCFILQYDASPQTEFTVISID